MLKYISKNIFSQLLRGLHGRIGGKMSKRIKITLGEFSYSYGASPVPPSDLNTRHCHDNYELLYVIDGDGKYIIEGREYPLRSHTLVVIPPLEYHYVDISPDASYERCVIRFRDSDVLPECREILSMFAKKDGEDEYFYISDMSEPAFTAIFEQLEYAENIPDAHRAFYISSLVSNLLLLLSVTERDKVTYDNAELGARVIKYLNEHIEKDVSLDKLAKRFFVSKYYLCRAFKKHNGISVHGYINQKRVMYAKQLIEGGESASSAAYRVGFGDYSAFYRAYVKILGKAPTA